MTSKYSVKVERLVGSNIAPAIVFANDHGVFHQISTRDGLDCHLEVNENTHFARSIVNVLIALDYDGAGPLVKEDIETTLAVLNAPAMTVTISYEGQVQGEMFIRRVIRRLMVIESNDFHHQQMMAEYRNSYDGSWEVPNLRRRGEG